MIENSIMSHMHKTNSFAKSKKGLATSADVSDAEGNNEKLNKTTDEHKSNGK